MRSLNNIDFVNLTCLCSIQSIEEQNMVCHRAAAKKETEIGRNDLSCNQKSSP